MTPVKQGPTSSLDLHGDPKRSFKGPRFFRSAPHPQPEVRSLGPIMSKDLRQSCYATVCVSLSAFSRLSPSLSGYASGTTRMHLRRILLKPSSQHEAACLRALSSIKERVYLTRVEKASNRRSLGRKWLPRRTNLVELCCAQRNNQC